jgi:hypothetical protein
MRKLFFAAHRRGQSTKQKESRNNAAIANRTGHHDIHHLSDLIQLHIRQLLAIVRLYGLTDCLIMIDIAGFFSPDIQTLAGIKTLAGASSYICS